jgi:hypothetical protein
MLNKEQGMLNKEVAVILEDSRLLLYSIFLVPCSIFEPLFIIQSGTKRRRKNFCPERHYSNARQRH